MARPRVFELGDRCSINIYLHPDQLEFIKKYSSTRRLSPSYIIRGLIDTLKHKKT